MKTTVNCQLIFTPAADQTKLTGPAKTAIRMNAEWLFVSSISAFEIAFKVIICMCRHVMLALPDDIDL
jgi:PIN domain nuclease of toxin-antitoxin system